LKGAAGRGQDVLGLKNHAGEGNNPGDQANGAQNLPTIDHVLA